MDIVGLIQERIKVAVKVMYGLGLTEVGVEHPQNSAWGDYSSNVALVQSKALGKSPMVLAKELVAGLKDEFPSGIFSAIQVAGPGFINFSLSKQFYLDNMIKILQEQDEFGKADLGKGSRVALEHSNVNPNKAAHIGHLRNAVIGQFLERAYEFLGYDVIVQYYANDLGVQVSTSLLGVKKLGNNLNRAIYDKFDHYMWDVYAKISQMLEKDEELKKELEVLMEKLDARDSVVSKDQKELSEKVLKDNIASFAALDIDYDLIVYESTIKDMHMWEIAFSELKDNKNVYKAQEGNSAGCWLVKMGDVEGIRSSNSKVTQHVMEEDKIIVRSNGIPTYTGKDIAYHMWKFGLLGIDFTYRVSALGAQDKLLYETTTQGEIYSEFSNNSLVLDVIDVRQTYAIDAVRNSLKHLGYKKQAESLKHINYGHVYLSNATAASLGYSVSVGEPQIAMSGRKGVGIKIDDFIEMVDKSLKDAHGDFPNSEYIRNSAIKFDILRYDTFQDVVFDISNALSIKGFTGPYIEYTHARTVSLLEKSGYVIQKDLLGYPDGSSEGLELGDSAVAVLRTLYRFPEVIQEAAKNYAPNTMCVYLYDLCQKFNSFYNDSPIINAGTSELREFRLLLTAATKQVIKTGLYLLGITAVARM